jgi:PH domain
VIKRLGFYLSESLINELSRNKSLPDVRNLVPKGSKMSNKMPSSDMYVVCLCACVCVCVFASCILFVSSPVRVSPFWPSLSFVHIVSDEYYFFNDCLPCTKRVLPCSEPREKQHGALLEGYLRKVGGKSRKKPGHWQKRYFVLRPSSLSYYKKPPKKSASRAKGMIELTTVTSVTAADSITRKLNRYVMRWLPFSS